MGKKSRDKKERKKQPHPTIFVFEGEVKHYEDGSMLELFGQVTPDEWGIIVRDTVTYKIFLKCLKEVAFPILKETWTREDEWWRLQLEVAESRMRVVDPMAFVGINQEAITKVYTDRMQNNAKDVVKDIEMIRQNQHAYSGDPARTEVSGL
jgi:hypothetical protein